MSNGRKVIPFKAISSGTYNAATEREKNVIGRRIADARKSAGLTLPAFSEVLTTCGVNLSHKSINKWEVGDSLPNAYQLLALCHALKIESPVAFFSEDYRPELNAEGMRKLEDYRADLISSGRYEPEEFSELEYIEMPVSFLAASAGTGAFLDEGNFEMVSFPKSSVPAGADFGVRVCGDSMEPVYSDGQIVWVQECESLRRGEVGIFVYDGDGYIKAYSERDPDEDQLEKYTDSYGVVHKQPVLLSYNKKYSPRVISPESNFQIVGRVL